MQPAQSEDRRLKAIGLALLGLSLPLYFWLAADVVNQWPPDARRFGPFLLVASIALNLSAFGLMWLAIGCGGSRPWRARASRRAWLLKLMVANLVLPMLVYGLLVDSESVSAELDESGWSTGFSAVIAVFAVAALWLYRRSRQHEARTAAQAMADDPRPPVLYLRSFQDDGRMLISDEGGVVAQKLFGALTPTSAEEELAGTLERAGPVVAIGKPGEPLPELGAARLYVGHDVWQAEVNALMRQAALVVVRVGASPGVLWEINQALEHLPRERLVLVLLGSAPLAPQIAERLAGVLGQALPAALPSPPPRWWAGSPNRRFGALVCFPPGEGARVVPVRSWPLAWADLGFAVTLRPAAGPLQRAWRDVFARLGLVWSAGPQRNRRLNAVLLAVWFGWCGAHWYYLGQPRRGRLYLLMLPIAMFPAWYDALRFVWVDRAEFDSRFGPAGR